MLKVVVDFHTSCTTCASCKRVNLIFNNKYYCVGSWEKHLLEESKEKLDQIDIPSWCPKLGVGAENKRRVR